MVTVDYIRTLEQEQVKKDLPEFRPGDTIVVGYRITEGDKTRIQNIEGLVIARQGGSVRETVTIRRTTHGEGVEITFPIHSPNVEYIKVKRKGKVRRAKLYYIRDKVGKAAKIKERQD